jgi:hypothetical protein
MVSHETGDALKKKKSLNARAGGDVQSVLMSCGCSPLPRSNGCFFRRPQLGSAQAHEVVIRRLL